MHFQIEANKVTRGFWQVTDGLRDPDNYNLPIEGHEFANVRQIDKYNRDHLNPDHTIPLGWWVSDYRRLDRSRTYYKTGNGTPCPTLRECVEDITFHWHLARPWLIEETS